MSRIGKQPIQLPKGVTVEVKPGNEVVVKGPKGVLTQKLNHDMTINQDNGVLTVVRPTEANHHRALHGLTRSLLNNMVQGVSAGFEKRLDIQGVGYRAEMKGNNLVLFVGYSHPVEVAPPAKDVAFAVENRGRLVIITATDKQMLGELAASIRKIRPPEPYKGKGIRYLDEQVRRKAGKAGKV
jgi:large subunit ribosomal protein L6